MASVTQNFMKLFRSSSSPSPSETSQAQQKLTRRSSGLGELARVWDSENPLCVLDLLPIAKADKNFPWRAKLLYPEIARVERCEGPADHIGLQRL